MPREGVSSYATLAATYVASFTLAHVFLKASDAGLETADSVLKWTSNEKVLRSAALGLSFIISLPREGGTNHDGPPSSAQRREHREEGWRHLERN